MDYKDNFVVSRTTKGNFQFHYMGFSYNKHNAKKLRCVKKNECPGYASYVDGIFSLEREHSCKPNIGAVKGKVAMEKMLSTARNTAMPTSQIVPIEMS